METESSYIRAKSALVSSLAPATCLFRFRGHRADPKSSRKEEAHRKSSRPSFCSLAQGPVFGSQVELSERSQAWLSHTVPSPTDKKSLYALQLASEVHSLNPRQKPGELQTLAPILGPAVEENAHVTDCMKFSNSARKQS